MSNSIDPLPGARPRYDRDLALRLPLRILLAEDNPVNLDLALRVLRKLGYQADSAADGEATVEALRRERYDLVLMDVQMPRLDGIAATRRIRSELPAAQQPQIIAMTANGQEERAASIAAGMDGYLTKPIDVQALQAELERAAGRTSPPPSPEPSQPATAVLHTLDPRVIAQLRTYQMPGEPDIVHEMLGMFGSETDKLIVDIRAALGARQAARLHHAAHTLKGSSGNLGATALADLAAQLDHLARHDDLDAAAQLLPAIEQAVAAVHQAIETECRRTV